MYVVQMIVFHVFIILFDYITSYDDKTNIWR